MGTTCVPVRINVGTIREKIKENTIRAANLTFLTAKASPHRSTPPANSACRKGNQSSHNYKGYSSSKLTLALTSTHQKSRRKQKRNLDLNAFSGQELLEVSKPQITDEN
jgi:hypothetical protein